MNSEFIVKHLFIKKIAFEIQRFANIINEDSNKKIVEGTADADTILNGVSNAVINGRAGNDSIKNDTVNSAIREVTVNGGEGNDTISNSGKYSFINGDDGNDRIVNRGSDSTINGGTGNDIISQDLTYTDNVSINGGDGEDYISIDRPNVNTVKGGKGNDTVRFSNNYSLKYIRSFSGTVYQYDEGDGDDLITGLTSLDTLQIAGNVSSVRTADGFSINVGNNIITVKDYTIVTSNVSNKTLTGSEYGDLFIGAKSHSMAINALDGNDTISQGDSTQYAGEGLSVSGGKGDDYMYFCRGNAHTLLGGNDNDTIIHSLGMGLGTEISSSNVIDGGTGNDYISSYGSYSTIIGGAGDDKISVSGSYSTVIGGTGNDSILKSGGSALLIAGGDGDDIVTLLSSGSQGSTVNCGNGNDTVYSTAEDEWGRSVKNIYQYSTGDGNDVIVNFNHSDELHVIGNFSTIESGNDIVIQVGEGSVILKDLKGKSIYCLNKNGINIISLNPDTVIIPDDYSGFPAFPADIDGSSTNESSTPSDTSNSLPNISIVPKNEIVTGSSTPITIINNGTIIINNNVTIIKNENTYTYDGGNKTISDYQQGEVVALASDFTGINLNENDFFINSSSGQLEIQNVRNKFVGYALNSSEVIAYSYMANDAGIIDGRDKNVLQVMTGANNADNQIYAGNAGSSLWGGTGGNDTLIGGEGTDEFFYASGSGRDVIENVDDNDVVNLLGVSLSQITYVSVEDSRISADFADGGHLEINSSSAVGFKVEGVTYAANRTDGSWFTK